MASAFQTVANQGAHLEPYYVEKILASDGTVVYQHQAQPVQVISPDVANSAISVLKGVLTRGTGRKGRLAGDRPAAGKTGTQSFNTNAWFVGATPQYTTAVWMGDPKGQTRMRNIPEFVKAGVNPVHGGDFPVQIWKYFMDYTHTYLPPEDWPPPPAPGRPPRRIYVPGEECVFRARAGAPPAAPVDPNAPPAPPAVSYGVDKKATGATVPPDVLDLSFPLTSVPAGTPVFDCHRGPPPPAPTPPPATAAPAPAAPAANPPP
jgi:membrane peptidoglycan carboxypeptidase